MDEKGKWDSEQEKTIREAKKEAEQIIKEAQEIARQIYGNSLEYVDDMLSEVNLIVLRSKEMMRLQMESMLDGFDAKIDLIAGHKQELLELLREHTKEGAEPIKKGWYEIKVDEAYFPRKTDYEIKVADEWKERVENMLAAANEPLETFKLEPEPEPEVEGQYKASDFNLDEEYFNWLEEKEQK